MPVQDISTGRFGCSPLYNICPLEKRDLEDGLVQVLGAGGIG